LYFKFIKIPAIILTNIQVFLIAMVMALFVMTDITSAAPAPSPTLTGAELFGLLAVKGLLLKGVLLGQALTGA